jgi:hypothetical protein
MSENLFLGASWQRVFSHSTRTRRRTKMNEWELAQQICDMPEVDEVIRGFAEDQTGDNATMIVREVVRALAKTPSNDYEKLKKAFFHLQREVIDLSTKNAELQVLTALSNQSSAGSHRDDIAVDRFAAAMKNKLAKKREEGRSGWETATPEYLSKLLLDHVAKADPIDVGNFCMMLFASESRIKFHENEPMNEEYWFNVCGWLHEKISELKAQLQDQQSTQDPDEFLAGMTHKRAANFMRRFKHEEKMLGKNEQAALDYVIALLAQQPAQEPVKQESWISVEDRLPKVEVGSYEFFLVTALNLQTHKESVFEAAFLNEMELYSDDHDPMLFSGWHSAKESKDYDGWYEPLGNENCKVTHWMGKPLPPVKEVTE